MPATLNHGIKILLLAVFLVIASYFFFDKPIAFWAYHHHVRQYIIFDYLTKIAVIFGVPPLFIYLYVIVQIAYQHFFIPERFLLAFANSIVISVFLKNTLKLIFSRYWTMTFKGNPSLIVNNVYGFNWFKFSALNDSFPSGHTTITVASVSVIAFFFPKLRWIAWSIALLVVLGLLADYYHFLSDIIAGGALGYLVAYYSVKILAEKT